MMNSLPRWFGLKTRKDKSNQFKKSQFSSQLEISESLQPDLRDATSSQSSQSRSSGSSDTFNENLYVNGQVPRGQFKEYFTAPETKHDQQFPQSRERPQVQRANSFRPNLERPNARNSYAPQLERSQARNSYAVDRERSQNRNSYASSQEGSNIRHSYAQPMERNQIRSSQRSIVPKTDVLISPFTRHGSIRSSLLKKSHSVDDVLEETIVAELVQDDNSSNYYNVQFARKARASSQMVLNHENLEQHNQVYLNKLIQARCRDPFGSSFLGHTLLSEMGHDLISEKADSVVSKDSGAVSLGGGTHTKFILASPLGT